jgi:hypothetical protein
MMAGANNQSNNDSHATSVAAQTSHLRGRSINKRSEAQRTALAELLPYLGPGYKFGVNGHDHYLCSEVHHLTAKKQLTDMGWQQTINFPVLELGPFKLTVRSAPAGTLITISEV